VGATFVYLPGLKAWVNLAQVTDAKPDKDGFLVVSLTGGFSAEELPLPQYGLSGEDRKVMEAALKRHTMNV
jgi:hypothetical protein